MTHPFDERWSELARRSRAAAEAPGEMPWGFAARTVARWQAERRSAPSAWAWERFAAVLVAGMTCVLMVLLAQELSASRPVHPLLPIPAGDDGTIPRFWQP